MPDFLELTRDLCAIPSGIVADGNDELFARIGRELPLTLHRWASGESYNGWVVPDRWTVEKAEIRKHGRLVFNGAENPLGVAFYSRSFRGTVGLAELKGHLFSKPDLPDAHMYHCTWLYKPWIENWGFCPPHRLVETLADGDYEIDLATSSEPGEMIVAEHKKSGCSPHTIIFHSNSCHPHMANDGFAGTAVMIRLFQWLAEQDTRYSYKLVIGPEHLGTVFYLRDHTPQQIDDYQCGVFGEMMGTPGPFKVAASFRGDHAFDRVFRHVARHYARNPEFVPFRQSVGNDEAVWEAPGYEVPFVQVNRALRWGYPFAEYHSNLDAPGLMSHDKLEEFYEVFRKVVFVVEHDVRMYRRFNGLIALSNPRYDLYVSRVSAVGTEASEETEKWGYLQDCIMRYFDGSLTLLDVAEKHDLPFLELYDYVAGFERNGLVRLEFEPMSRPATQWIRAEAAE